MGPFFDIFWEKDGVHSLISGSVVLAVSFFW